MKIFKRTTVSWWQGILRGLAEVLDGLIIIISLGIFHGGFSLLAIPLCLYKEINPHPTRKEINLYLRGVVRRTRGPSMLEMMALGLADIFNGVLWIITFGKLTTNISLGIITFSNLRRHAK
ncbi:MAG: hypothetical protein WC242_00845 [Candidatus Paceibacterota bacterium]|jgi:hypothetical protein